MYHKESYRILMFDEMVEYHSFIKKITQELKESPTSHGFNNLAVAYIETDQIDKALVALDNGLKIDNSNSTLYINRAELLIENKSFNDAEKDFDTALELSPINVSFWTTRAYYHLDRGDLKKALNDFNQANDLHPHFSPTKTQIKNIELKLGLNRPKWFNKMFRK